VPRHLATLALLGSLAACGGISACGPALRGESEETRKYPSYTPGEASVFDDSISASVVSDEPWAADAKFGDRIRRSDSVTPARILTLTEQPRVEGMPLYIVELQPFGQALAGRPDRERVRLELAPDNPAYRLFRWQQGNLLGKDVLLFYRKYAQDGVVTVHFRAEPNTPATHYAVSNSGARPLTPEDHAISR
jgi:hypothetical protein